MKNVPLKTLKENLSWWVGEAARGEQVQVTKYNRPYILLASCEGSGLYRGKRAGQATLKSVLHEGTGGKWLKVLLDDRKDRRDDA